MKRVLVVSDNPALARCFRSIVEEQELLKAASFEYRYSSVNKTPQAMAELGFRPVNISGADGGLGEFGIFDLVFSIHCKQIFPSDLVSKVLCVNLHPGFNPYNRGWYPQVFSILNKHPVGATLHVMTPDVDAGPVIAQEAVGISSWDTSLDVYLRVQKAEERLLRSWLGRILAGNFDSRNSEGTGQFNSLADFRRMCRLDLNSQGTLGSHLDLLRALSHGEFENAYFVDDSGHKVYVKVQLRDAGAVPGQ